MEETSFDNLARTLATGSASRRHVVRGLIGAVLGGAGTLLGGVQGEARHKKKCKPNYCRGCVKHCDGDRNCALHHDASGGTVCASILHTCTPCATDDDCHPNGARCVRNGSNCCGGSTLAYEFTCAGPCLTT